MVIAAFDNDEQIHRVRRKLRLVRQAARRKIDNARGVDFLLAPHRQRGNWRVGKGNQRLDFLVIQLLAEALHLRCRATITDDFFGLRLAQARQVFRQQRRANAAQPLSTVTGGTMLLEIGGHIGSQSRACHGRQQKKAKNQNPG